MNNVFFLLPSIAAGMSGKKKESGSLQSKTLTREMNYALTTSGNESEMTE